MAELTKHEEILLITILQLRESAYGVFIRRKIINTLSLRIKTVIT